jgi:hypothetical protein
MLIEKRLAACEAALGTSQRAPIAFYNAGGPPDTLFTDNALTKRLEPEELKRMHERAAVLFIPSNGRG